MSEHKIEVGQVYQSSADDCMYEIKMRLNKSETARTFMVTCLDSKVGRGDCPFTESQIKRQIDCSLWHLIPQEP